VDLPALFETCRRLCRPDGVILLAYTPRILDADEQMSLVASEMGFALRFAELGTFVDSRVISELSLAGVKMAKLRRVNCAPGAAETAVDWRSWTPNADVTFAAPGADIFS